MNESAFAQIEFYALTMTSVLLPIVIFVGLSRAKKVRRSALCVFGLILLFLAAADVILLERLAVISKLSVSLLDDTIFASELTVGLYMLPLISAGLGVNLLSHLLITHLDEADES